MRSAEDIDCAMRSVVVRSGLFDLHLGWRQVDDGIFRVVLNVLDQQALVGGIQHKDKGKWKCGKPWPHGRELVLQMGAGANRSDTLIFGRRLDSCSQPRQSYPHHSRDSLDSRVALKGLGEHRKQEE
jgi:hypothetical protein